VSLDVEVVEDPARACSAILLSAVLGGGHVVLTGGSTPRAAYEELARALRSIERDFGRATLWFGDERCVPPDDELSNYRLAKEALLDPLADLATPDVRRMKGELGPDEGADDYERELRSAGTPKFDLLLLGIGPDGHVASLFPNQATLAERSRLVIGVPEAGHEPFVPRITLTLPAILSAKQIVFLATGDSKADPVAAALGPDAIADPHVPASMVAAAGEEVTVLLDPAAAAKLR
jgi:6-phosphogluconolactonase